MPLGLKNAPPTYQQVVSTTFKDYIGMFMKLFMYDFNVFNNLNTHLTKLWLCFDKCSGFVSLKLEKCMFHVHSKVILGYVYPRLTIGFEKNLIIVHVFTLKTLKDI
jgi:hypothetical protein